VENGNGISKKQRRPRHDNDKSFISFWIATGGQSGEQVRFRNDDPSEKTATTKRKTETT
jgi:hypothetical protein